MVKLKKSSQSNTPAVVHPFMNSVHSQKSNIKLCKIKQCLIYVKVHINQTEPLGQSVICNEKRETPMYLP